MSDEPLESRFPGEYFDTISLIFVLEHIADPVAFLRHLKRFLKPGGKIVVLVPNYLDPLVNLYDIGAFRSFYFCIEHLYYFTPQTIESVFNKAGLRGVIETLQEYPLSNHINWAFRQKPSDTLAARSGLPDIELIDGAPLDPWKRLWDQMDVLYRRFLSDNGYGDRIWAEISIKH